MTRSAGSVLALLCFMSGSACAKPQPEAPAVAGTYEFVYPHNTADLIENHYIMLQDEGGLVRGWYYGTSDEFDTAREGYLPGFFVAEMQELSIAGDSIHFTLAVPNGEFFTKAIPLRYRSTREVPLDQFEKWRGPATAEHETYRGVVSGDQVTLNTRFGSRVFRRVIQP